MRYAFRTLDRYIDHLHRTAVLVLALCGVLIVGTTDYLTGYEVALSLFYLGPVALTAWYAGRRSGMAVAVLSCMSWYGADIMAGHPYSHPAIAVWNALVRFGFFIITSLLVSRLRETVRIHQHLALMDDLTGLYGRRAFEERLKHDLAVAQRHDGVLTLVYVDLDDFKAVNDTHGHAEGDRALRVIGQVLSNALRGADTVARIGGDEFALVLPGTDGRGARQVISKLTSELHEALDAAGLAVTCSVGVVTFLDGATSPDHAVAAADELMYQVKRSGKGAVAFRVLGSPIRRAAATARR